MTKLKHIQVCMKAVSPGAHIEQPSLCTVNFMDRSGQSHLLKVEVDSGSYCSIIPRPFFNNQLRSLHLQPLKGPSYAYGGIPIEDFDGFCRVRVELDGTVCTADVMVSASEVEPIIGWDIINGLSLVIRGTLAGTANAGSVPITNSDNRVITKILWTLYLSIINLTFLQTSNIVTYGPV